MSMYISSFTVVISVNCANEFRELFEDTTFFFLMSFTEYINECSITCKNVIRGPLMFITILLLFDIFVVTYKFYFTLQGY
jgi:hypothetical protein